MPGCTIYSYILKREWVKLYNYSKMRGEGVMKRDDVEGGRKRRERESLTASSVVF